MEQLPERVNPALPPTRPAQHVPETQLKRIIENNELSVGQLFWDGMSAIPSEQPLVTTSRSGERQLAVSAVRDVLEVQYATKGAAGWPRVGKKTLYTLNLLATYLGGESIPDADQQPEMYVDPPAIAAFCKARGIAATKDLISGTIQRLGGAIIGQRYSAYTNILPEGRYSAEDTTFVIDDSQPYSRVDVEKVGLQSILAGITNVGILHEANAHPRTHYALLQWFLPLLCRPSNQAAAVTRRPPEHPAIRQELAPTVVPSEQYEELLRDRVLVGGNEKRPSVVRAAQRAIDKGLFYPLTGLVVTDGERSAFSSDRVARFLTSMIRSNLDELPRTTLISEYEFRELAELDLNHGTYEELPRAKTVSATWHHAAPAITLKGLVDFGRNLGREVDVDDMKKLMNGIISMNLRERHQYAPGDVYMQDGAVYEYVQHNATYYASTSDVETRGMTIGFAREHFRGFGARDVVTALIFAKYIKAATQQS